MELNELRSFSVVVKSGSFSKAAENLGYSQSAVTVQIRNLEKELGVLLFDRLGKKIHLTEDGKIFYDYVENILNKLEEARGRLEHGTEPSGKLRVGTIDSICSCVMPQLLDDYHREYPKVSLSITTDSPRFLLEMLADNDIDILYLLDEEVNDMRFSRVLNESEKVCFAAASNHPVFRNLPSTWEELLSFPFILTEKDASYRKVLDYRLGLRKLSIEPIFESNNTDLMLRMVKAGEGITFLPEYALQDSLDDGSLTRIDIPDFETVIWRQLLVHKDKYITREIRAFIDLVMKDGSSRTLMLR